MSRWISPPLARLTRAIGSPVEKWTTSSTSMLAYGWPRRRTGIFNSVDSYRGRRREAPERPDATDSVPRILFVRRLALAFIPLEKAGHEELLRQRRQLDAAGFP